jgi:hypothetical protein
MRRVRIIRTLRLLTNNVVLAIVLGVLALYGIGREVWVARVLENAPHTANLFAFARFYLVALENTRFLVQVLVCITLASSLYVARALGRVVAALFLPAHA